MKEHKKIGKKHLTDLNDLIGGSNASGLGGNVENQVESASVANRTPQLVQRCVGAFRRAKQIAIVGVGDGRPFQKA